MATQPGSKPENALSHLAAPDAMPDVRRRNRGDPPNGKNHRPAGKPPMLPLVLIHTPTVTSVTFVAAPCGWRRGTLTATQSACDKERSNDV